MMMLLIPWITWSQTNRNGSIEIIQDPAIAELVKKHIMVNEVREGFPGYRIQIFFDSGTNSKVKAKMICEEFQSKFPDMVVYLTFISPNYKVRVGDFRSRLDASRFLQELQLSYPNAYVVQDQIKLPITEKTLPYEQNYFSH